MSGLFQNDTASSYNKVAAEYTKKFQHELSYKPFDCKMLEFLVEKVGENRLICDLGCGPGQVAGYLYQVGARVCGIDLSSQMVAEAQRLYPDIPFQQGNMSKLENIENESWDGIAAFYSIIHVPRLQVVDALREMWRVLQEDGRLLLTFHIGDEVRHIDTWFEKSVNLDFAFFETKEMKDYLRTAGFIQEELIERDPYPEEVQTRRAYVFARKPS